MASTLVRRGAVGVFLASAGLIVAACGGSSGSGSGGEAGAAAAPKGSIAFLLPDTAVSRYESFDRPYFAARMKQICPKCKVIYNIADGVAATQLQQAENAITAGAKVLVINPIDPFGEASVVQSAKAAGVKVISYGRLIQNSEVDYGVSANLEKIGRDQATSLVEGMTRAGKPNGPIVEINGQPGDTDAAQVKRGAKAVFAEKNVKVAAEFDTPKWAPETAQTEMDQAITRLGKDGFAGVYSMNDGMAGGIIAAMKGAGIDPSTRPVTGLDADVAALQRIVAGQQYMTEFQDFKDQAGRAADIAVALLKGQKPDPKLFTSQRDNGKVKVPTYEYRVAPITKSNLKEEAVDSGYVSVAQLCTTQYAAACGAAGIQ